MRLSNNFSLNELTKSQTAVRFGISNRPNDEELENLKFLVTNLLQPLREALKRPIRVTSAFRSPELSLKIGSSATSQHCKGQAADFEVTGYDNFELANYIVDHFGFDQLILEYYNAPKTNSGWIHCSIKKEGNRREMLTAARNPETGATDYFNGLVLTPYE